MHGPVIEEELCVCRRSEGMPLISEECEFWIILSSAHTVSEGQQCIESGESLRALSTHRMEYEVEPPGAWTWSLVNESLARAEELCPLLRRGTESLEPFGRPGRRFLWPW